jgi:Ca2+-binding EF-hand superfamily protein
MFSSGCIFIGAAICVLVTSAPLAFAQDSQPLALIWFQQIDTDGDDAISGAELDDMRTRRFVQIDLDRDRALTPTEFMQDLSNDETELIERREKRFALMDSDGNGQVDVIEYIGFGSSVMKLLDTDSDGYIRRAEFTQAVATPE